MSKLPSARGWRASVVACGVMLLATACDDTLSSARAHGFGYQCTFNRDCDDPLICAARFCREQCINDRDCRFGMQYVCSASGQRNLRACVPPDSGVLCGNDDPCGAPLVCKSTPLLFSECHRPCVSEGDCAGVGACDQQTHTCTLPVLVSTFDAGSDAGPGDDATEGGATDVNADGADARSDGQTADALDVNVDTADAGDATSGDASIADGPGDLGADVCGPTRCGTTCGIDLMTNANDCGACGHVCSAARMNEVGACVGGSCTSVCVTGRTRCPSTGGTCVDTTVTAMSCGACGTVCTSRCAAGVCAHAEGGYAAGNNSLVRFSDGSYWGFGQGRFPYALTSFYLYPSSAVPLRVSSLDGLTGIAFGEYHLCALRGDRVICAGHNDTGQLGDGTMTDHTLAAPSMPTVSAARQVATLYDHACALQMDRTVWCWGNNANGQLGDITITRRLSPVQVQLTAGTPLTGVAEIGVGGEFSCALMVADGSVLCWGVNSRGQLGRSTTVGTAHMPAPVSGITGATRLWVAYDHACVLLGDATLRCWGNNTNGVLGDGTTVASSAVPVRPLDLSGVADLAMSTFNAPPHACALTTSGEVLCWGTGAEGQIGDGNAATTPRRSPVPVMTGGTFHTARSIAAGAAHTCVIGTDDFVVCWGRSTEHQLGFDTGAAVRAPSNRVQWP